MIGSAGKVRSVWIAAGIPRAVPGGMRRHMELHARGLELHGISARLLFAEDGLSRPAALTRRAPGAALLANLLADARSEKPDVVNVHTLAAPAWILARAAGLVRSRIVVMSYAADERGLEPGTGIRALIRRTRMSVPARALFSRASGIWCVNTEDAEYYARSYRVPTARIAVIPHAVEPSFLARASVERDWNQVLFVGTWSHRKGSDVLSQAMTSVLRRDARCRFVIAGTLSPPGATLRNFGQDVIERITIFPL